MSFLQHPYLQTSSGPQPQRGPTPGSEKHQQPTRRMKTKRQQSVTLSLGFESAAPCSSHFHLCVCFVPHISLGIFKCLLGARLLLQGESVGRGSLRPVRQGWG